MFPTFFQRLNISSPKLMFVTFFGYLVITFVEVAVVALMLAGSA